MKIIVFTFLISFISACAISPHGGYELTASPELVFPPTWTHTPEPPKRTLSPPTATPSPTTTPLPIEGCNAQFISDSVVPGGIPSLSSDGQTFVYLCGSAEDARICLMSKDGNNRHLISDELGNLVDPQWSPTEETIAFVQSTNFSLQDNDPPSSDIYLSSHLGDTFFQVTHNPTMMNHAIEEIQWSPDGKRIAFSAGGFIGSEAIDIYVINFDGSMLRRLSFPPALNYSPRWSPDGSQLAYYSMSVEGITYLVIVAMNEYGELEMRIPLRIGGDLSWSPDGQSLLYTDITPDLRGDYDLHIYDLINAQEYQLTTGDFVDFQPLWSKDGSAILFTSNLDGNFDLYTMTRDGSEVIKQVDNHTDAYIHNPIWTDDGKSIYFFLSGGREDIYEMWAVDPKESCE